MSEIIFSITIVSPILVYILIGYSLRSLKMVSSSAFAEMNTLVFNVLLL